MRYIAVLTIVIGTTFSAGCGTNCADLKAEQASFIESRSPFQELPDNNQVHFGVTLKDAVLDKIAQSLLTKTINSAMNLTTKVNLGGGKSVAVKTLPTVEDLSIRADSSCDHCVRVAGKVGGKVTVKIPIIGEQSVPLNGNLALVAPLVFDKGSKKDAAIKVNLSEAAKIGKSSLQTKISQLPPTWSKGLQSPITNALLEAITKELPDITVFEFDAPDMGIKGLKVKPTKLVTDAKNHTIFVGLGSNLVGPKNSISPFTSLSAGQNVAIGLHPQLLANAAESLIGSGTLSRTYDSDGKEASGPISIVPLSTVGSAAGNGVALNTKFRMWNAPNSGQCYWADVVADSKVSLKDGKVRVDVEKFDVTDTSLPGIVLTLSKWTNAAIWSNQKRVFETGLTDQAIELPGKLNLSLKPSGVRFVDNGLWVTSKASVK